MHVLFIHSSVELHILKNYFILKKDLFIIYLFYSFLAASVLVVGCGLFVVVRGLLSSCGAQAPGHAGSS